MISVLAGFSETAQSLRFLSCRYHGSASAEAREAIMFVFPRSFWTVAAGLGTAFAVVVLTVLST
jgi:hypothetical protein